MNVRFLLLCTILGAVILFIFVYLPGYSEYQELRHKEARLSSEIEKLKSVNEELRKEVNLLQTDITHLEKVLRDEMGLVKPGETVYKVIEDEPPQVTIQEAPEQEAAKILQ